MELTTMIEIDEGDVYTLKGGYDRLKDRIVSLPGIGECFEVEESRGWRKKPHLVFIPVGKVKSVTVATNEH